MLYNDHFQNFKVYQIPKAQLIIADIPYNLGNNAYASNPAWYKAGDNKNGESELAGKEFFDTEKNFKPMDFRYSIKNEIYKIIWICKNKTRTNKPNTF
jgi:site-specific DNA-methyltransferase (adenine-specific)